MQTVKSWEHTASSRERALSCGFPSPIRSLHCWPPDYEFENLILFYADYKPELSKEEKTIKQVDLGIALSHFHQTALDMGLTGTLEQMHQEDSKLPENIHYMISWRITE